MPLPLPAPEQRWSLFLDFDGTLTEIADTPGAVRIDPRLPATLAELAATLDGAVALVSGRPVAELDRLLAPARLPTAGLHGLQQRFADGEVRQLGPHNGALAGMRAGLARFVAEDPRLLIEDKGQAIALHYRGAPERADECREAVILASAEHREYQVLEGKMVFEIKPRSMDKGRAIEAFMQHAPFAGGTPAFVGDDTTDEDGFRIVNSLGGLTVKVGAGATAARHRIGGVPALLGWLHALPGRLAGGEPAR